MEKQEILNQIKELTEASIHHYAVINGDKRGKVGVALKREVAAVIKLLKSFGVEVTKEEVEGSIY